jgi:hypothetical protein
MARKVTRKHSLQEIGKKNIAIVICEDEWKTQNRDPKYFHRILTLEFEKRGQYNADI